MRAFGGRLTVMLCSTAKTYGWLGSISAGFFVAATLVLAGCGSSTSVASTQTATPVFSPGAMTSTTPLTVKISDATSGAVLYCTTDGTTPTTSSPLCSQPTTVSQSEFLQAIAVAPGMATSAGMSAYYTISLNPEDTPVFTPAGGNYSSAQTVTIANSSGANIFYCVTAGCTPTTASTAYSGPIPVSVSETVNAIAATSGYANSSVASATYAIVPPLAAPTFSPGSATLRVSTPVTISAASGSAIYYTTDGSIPPSSTSSIISGSPVTVTVSQGETINAVAELGTQTSAMTSAAYAFVGTGAVPSPTFSPGDGGTVRAAQDPITLGDTDSKASIYYTYDGTSPYTYSSTYGTYSPSATAQLYSVPFRLPLSYATTGSALVQAFALDAGTGSQPSSAYYIVKPDQYAQPVFSPAAGVVTASQTVSIAEADTSAPVYYNIDSSTVPTSASTLYTGTPITLSTGIHTIQAIALDPYDPNPSVVSSTYFVGTTGSTIYGAVSSAGTAITGAKVQLYAAGYTGYGSAPIALGSAVTTDSGGLFSVSGYVCTPAPADQVYLVATGGTEGSNSSSNSKIALMTALGSCGSLPAAVTTSGAGAIVNEVTTIASTYALSGFAKVPTSGGGIDIGAPGTGSECNAANKDINGNSQPWRSTGPETCNYNGLASAFKTVNNLVNVTGAAQSYTYSCAYASSTFTCTSGSYSDAAGAARSITPAYANGNTPKFGTDGTLCAGSASTTNGCNISGSPANYAAAPYLNSSTVPTYRINALADMLATCVESDGSGCASGLFAGATTGAITTTSTLSVPNVTPIDTLQAALNIAQNPGNNVSTLLGLVSSTPPYSTGTLLTQTTQPVDLALALTYTGAGLGLNPSTTVDNVNVLGLASDSAGDTNLVPSIDTALAVDASGNIWVAAYTDALTNDGYGDSIMTPISPFLAVFDNQGTPLTQPTTMDTSLNVTFGGFSPHSGSGSALNQMAFDQAGNLWAAENSYTGRLDEITGFPSSLTSTNITFPNRMQTPRSMAVDGNIVSGQTSGNVWVWDSENLWEIAPGSQPYAYYRPTGIGGTESMGNMVFDSFEDIWATTGYWPSTLKTEPNDFEEVASAPSSPSSLYSFGTNTPVLDGYPSGESSKNQAPPIAGSDGNLYLCSDTGGVTVDTFIAGNGKVGSFTPASGLGCGGQMVLDGQNHLFAVPRKRLSDWSEAVYLDEFTTSGAQVFPVLDAHPGSSSAEPPTLVADNLNVAQPVPGVSAAMDASGNLWVLNNDTDGGYWDANFNPVSTPVNVLVEYVGIGAPVATPASAALSSGTLGARP